MKTSKKGARKPTCVELLFLGLIFLFLWACGASRQTSSDGGSIDIDDLINEGEVNASNTNPDDSEVLKLLGITPAVSQPATTEPTAEIGKLTAEELESDIEQLRGELLEKDKQISELRSVLTKKEVEISDLADKVKAATTTRTATRPGSASLPDGGFTSRYQAALDLFKARKYQEAIAEFRQLISIDTNNSLSDNCQYWIGECYYGLVNFNQAIAEFEKVFSFPNSNKSDDAQLKLGICYFKLGDKPQARSEFERLLSIYPDSEYKGLAEKYIARL